MRRGLGPTGIDGVSKSAHDSGVPGIMKILRARIRIDLDTVAAVIGIVGRMERLMEIADEMDQEREVTGRAPSVVISVFQSLRVFVDFIGDAVTARASPGDVPSRIAQTNVDEVPRTRRAHLPWRGTPPGTAHHCLGEQPEGRRPARWHCGSRAQRTIRLENPTSRRTTGEPKPLATEMQMANLIRDIDTIGVVLIENRWFDHVLGYLGQARLLTPIRCAITESCVPSHIEPVSE